MSISTREGITFTVEVNGPDFLKLLTIRLTGILEEHGVKVQQVVQDESIDVNTVEPASLPVPAILLSKPSLENEIARMFERFTENLADEFSYQFMQEFAAAAMWSLLSDDDRGKLIKSIAERAKKDSRRRIREWAVNRKEGQGEPGRPRPSFVEELEFEVNLREAIIAELKEHPDDEEVNKTRVALRIYSGANARVDRGHRNTALNTLKDKLKDLKTEWEPFVEKIKSEEKEPVDAMQTN